MVTIQNYLDDGANFQAKATMCALQWGIGDGIKESWSDEFKRYTADVKIARWENCREQGYVVSLRNKDFSRQLNIAFFEHRNSDSICAVKWEQLTMNSPTIDTAEFGDAYKDKWDTSYEVGFGEFLKMAEWIKKELVSFWKK